MSATERARLRELATLTLNGNGGSQPWLPYEETWHSLATGVLALADALDEEERTIAHLREALNQHAHVAEFRDDGWGLEHPVECREKGLLDCPVNAAIGALWVQPSIAPGRYVISLADDGELLIGEALA